jgi:RNA polymerase sigma factor (sigma-70 family)
MDESKKEQHFKNVIKKNKKEMRNPLIKGFLEDENNFNLFKQAIMNFTEENKKLVEEAFAEYYEDIRKISYFSNMIKFLSIDFDKKIRKLNNRFLLTLDQPLRMESDESVTMKDIIVDSSVPTFNGGSESLKSQISDEKLYQALDILTKKQFLILELIYVRKLSNIEVAEIVQSTPQNVSNLHKKALKKLKNHMKGT